MKIAILGFAGQGISSYDYWNTPENEITICDFDANTLIPPGAKSQLGAKYLDNLDRFDLLIRTPALHPDKIQQANKNTPDILDRVWSNTNEFLKVCPTRNIIGVTGTKGKGTTSSLITSILKQAGHKVHLGGNIGTPPLDLLKENISETDWVVLELANFQLIDLKISPHIAVCLMIEPEHLNWHDNVDDYVNAKRQLFIHQSENDIAIYYSDNHCSRSIAESSPGLIIPYMAQPGAYVVEHQNYSDIMIEGEIICQTTDINLIGRHNWQNVCAAITATWNITQNIAATREAIKNFYGLPHRLEKVRQINGVTYYNDSFSAAPSATMAAIEAIPGTKILIVGGVDKNLDLNELARSILINKETIYRVLIIGEVASKLEAALTSHGITSYDVLRNVNMNDIVNHANKIARKNDVVVLSPGTSSFDMFKNFEDRGLQFKAAVKAL